MTRKESVNLNPLIHINNRFARSSNFNKERVHNHTGAAAAD